MGWRDIEIVRLPTGQPTVRLHGRAAERAEQLGMGRIAVSISHEGDYAVAIAFGIRTEGGAFVFPPDIEQRIAERERDAHEPSRAAARAGARTKIGAMILDAATAAALIPKRDPDGHKGTFGTVLCVCGSLDYAGAGLLAGTAAARAGAGLVVLAVPASLQALFAGRVPELVTLGLPEQANNTDIDAMESVHALKPRQADALVVGCGLRESDGYRELVSGLMTREGPPMVVDGGALNMLAGSGEWWRGAQRECVLTPHPGEFERLAGTPAGHTDAERAAAAVAAAQRFGQVVVLKGARTVIADASGTTAVSPFANPALAT